MTKFKHTPEQARALVAKALRSGKYEQGRMVLEREDKTFCCLGVAGTTSMHTMWGGRISS